MVATSRAQSPSVSMRRSFTSENCGGEQRELHAPSRRHSVAVASVLHKPVERLDVKKWQSPTTSSLPRKLFAPKRAPKDSRRRSADDGQPFGLQVIGPAHAALQASITDILHGFRAQVPPVAVDDGTGGVYFLRSKAQRIVAVFKPSDEEPFAVNNPKDHRPVSGDVHERNNFYSCRPEDGGIRRGITPGQAAIREVAAFLLDHEHRAGVPPTVLVAAQHPTFYVKDQRSAQTHCKIGSFQHYVPHDCTADDVSERQLPVEQVHAMAVLDIRLANQDRHGGNVLVSKAHNGKYNIVPIDHGACLPRATCMDETNFLWLSWPQAKIPFSADTITYIASLDAAKEVEDMKMGLPMPYQLDSDALMTLSLCTELLRVCALDYGMTAYDIGLLMCRDEDPEVESVVERLIHECYKVCVSHELKEMTQLFRQLLLKYLDECEPKISSYQQD